MNFIKFLLFFLITFSAMPSFAIYSTNPWENDDGLKYSIVKAVFNNTPVLKAPKEGSEVFTYLKKDINFYVKNYDSKFYMLDLGFKSPLWVEKSSVTLVKKVPDRGGVKVSKIKLYENKNNYLIKMKTKNDIEGPYLLSGKGKEINFRLYNLDTRRKKGEIYKPNTPPYKIISKNKAKEGENINIFVLKENGLSDVLCVNFKSKAPLFSYDVEKENKSLVLKIRKPPVVPLKRPLKNIKIALDPGHGGYDSGAVLRDVKEKDLNLQIAKNLGKILKKRGANVVLTRKKDTDVSLYKRLEIVKKKDVDYLISIQQNTLQNPEYYEKIHGVHTYYHNDNAKNLAYSIQQSLLRATNFKDDGVTDSKDLIINSPSPVAVLVKPGYIINPYERAKLSDKEFQKTVAAGIADGIQKHLKSVRNHHYQYIKDAKHHKNL